MPRREWVAVYYDNPEEVPAEKRCATAVAWTRVMSFRANSEGVIWRRLPAKGLRLRPRAGGGLRLRYPWMQFFDGYGRARRIASPQPCFEGVYLNDGNHGGYWDIDMYDSR